jgi:tripartite-type tricarboxylate transporter receptor subunit TctC
MRSRFRMAAVAAALLAVAGATSAQSTFPAKPVHTFVPDPAGGGVDVLARTLGERILVGSPARLYSFPN